MTDEALAERLAGVLRAHKALEAPPGTGVVIACSCTWRTQPLRSDMRSRDQHRAHVAAELAAVVREVEAAAASRALTEAADEIEAELVCCDVFERLRDKRASEHTEEQKVEHALNLLLG